MTHRKHNRNIIERHRRIAYNLVLAIFATGFNCRKITDRLDLENREFAAMLYDEVLIEAEILAVIVAISETSACPHMKCNI